MCKHFLAQGKIFHGLKNILSLIFFFDIHDYAKKMFPEYIEHKSEKKTSDECLFVKHYQIEFFFFFHILTELLILNFCELLSCM